ncbi:MAG: radical SAM protein [Bacteroidaceae bacterium]|nr:radical SAM protein [Bacteroidaceae bacterium]
MARLIAISRHRIATDGKGVTTLVAFHGCPLDCRYCLNKQCKDEAHKYPEYSPARLLEEVRVDDLYFQATGGGVTFGGGEPLLHPDFIAEFRELCPPEWKINVESSLAVPMQNVQKIAPLADCMIIDIKDLDDDIYRRYTGRSNALLMSNLRWIAEVGLQDKCKVRLPLIKGYNSRNSISRSRIKLAVMGFRYFDEFKYIIKNDATPDTDSVSEHAAHMFG